MRVKSGFGKWMDVFDPEIMWKTTVLQGFLAARLSFIFTPCADWNLDAHTV